MSLPKYGEKPDPSKRPGPPGKGAPKVCTDPGSGDHMKYEVLKC